MLPGRVMTPLLAVCAIAAGCISAEPPVELAAAETPAPLATNSVEWTGHIALSQTDVLLHLSPTDAILWPYEQAGFVLVVPENATELEVVIAWDGPGDFWIHTHSHEAAQENLVSFQSEFGSGNPHCIRIPPESVTPGHWMIMAHSREAVQTDFTVTALTVGGPATISEEYHGHEDWTEPLMMDEREFQACTLWQAPE